MTADQSTISRELSGLGSAAAVLEAYSETGGVTSTCSRVWQSTRSVTRIRLCWLP